MANRSSILAKIKDKNTQSNHSTITQMCVFILKMETTQK